MSGEDRIRLLRGVIFAYLRGACLEHDRLPLLRTGNIQRPFHREELPFMVQRMHFLRIKKDTRLLVADKRVILPGIP
ncbi:hypothetical protein D3C86_1777660 [compost metagenome]